MSKRTRVLPVLLSVSWLFVCLPMAVTPMVANASIYPTVSMKQSNQPTWVSESQPDRDDPLPLRKANLKLRIVGDKNNLGYGGGRVMVGTAHAYAIFWEPTGNVSARYNALIKRYFRDVGGSPLYQIARQYTQFDGRSPANAVLAASWVDSRPYLHSPLLDVDIQREVMRAQRINGWHSSLSNVFFVFTERNRNVCFDGSMTECTKNGYCAYHSAFGKNTIYAVVPYIASFDCDPYPGPNHDDADQTITALSHEQLEAATDPLGDGWIDSEGQEIADKCADDYGRSDAQGANVIWNRHLYLVQKEWDNHTGRCRLTPSFHYDNNK
ncbi:MAG TPA: hypothetical protein VFV38_50290 [Ktedonobacteraceae bacterium]|nr:hypothetical protein [Ktedonobacteraceae bacterium]